MLKISLSYTYKTKHVFARRWRYSNVERPSAYWTKFDFSNSRKSVIQEVGLSKGTFSLDEAFVLVDISQEPFFRSLLIAAFRDRLRCLKQRSNVSIPRAYGRAMFGIIDESRTLQYGEVFLQHTSNSQLESEIVLGYVAVTKNPCLYPGTKRTSLEKSIQTILFRRYSCTQSSRYPTSTSFT